MAAVWKSCVSRTSAAHTSSSQAPQTRAHPRWHARRSPWEPSSSSPSRTHEVQPPLPLTQPAPLPLPFPSPILPGTPSSTLFFHFFGFFSCVASFFLRVYVCVLFGCCSPCVVPLRALPPPSTHLTPVHHCTPGADAGCRPPPPPPLFPILCMSFAFGASLFCVARWLLSLACPVAAVRSCARASFPFFYFCAIVHACVCFFLCACVLCT